MRIPQRIIDHVMSAAPGEARAVATRLTERPIDDQTKPEQHALVLLVNGYGMQVLGDMMLLAVEHAPTPEHKEGYRAFALQIANAMAQTTVS